MTGRLSCNPASATEKGCVSTTAQVFAGAKGFAGAVHVDGGFTLAAALPVAQGGTAGTASPVDGGVCYGAAGAYAFSPAAADAGQMLLSGGAGVPTWGPRVVAFTYLWDRPACDAGMGGIVSPWIQVPGGLNPSNAPLGDGGGGGAPCAASCGMGSQGMVQCLGIPGIDGGVVILQVPTLTNCADAVSTGPKPYDIIVFDRQ